MTEPFFEVFKPPAVVPQYIEKPCIFLAGSIEMGAAEDWQVKIEEACHDLGVALLNPRRDQWDSSWEQRADNPVFKGQVEWELEGLERASLVLFYFAPNTKSPVTLAEFGLVAQSGKAVVCCPEGFWRKGNVDIMCERYGVPQVESLNDLIRILRARFS